MKYRSLHYPEAFRRGIKNCRSEDIRWQCIRRELNSGKIHGNRICKSLGKRGLSNPGNILDQHMPSGQQRDDQLIDRILIP